MLLGSIFFAAAAILHALQLYQISQSYMVHGSKIIFSKSAIKPIAGFIGSTCETVVAVEMHFVV